MELWSWSPTLLSGPDLLVLALLVAAMVAIGYGSAQRGQDTSSFFLGRRQIPGWAACLSFVATEVSAVTLIAVPATAFMENWEYAQFFIGSAAARFFIAYWFIPAFYRYNCTTIYEFLKHRFGPETQYTGTLFFFVTRLLGSGVRLMAACLAVSVLLGWKMVPTIFVFTLVSVAYIAYGGIRSVVWTGVFQSAVFITAGLASLGYLLSQINGGLHGVWEVAGAAGRLHLWNWGPAVSDPAFFVKFLKDPNILWIAILNGFFGSMAAFGTDHELMQRLLTVDTRQKSQRTMVTTPAISFFVLCIYLAIGSSLYTFYAQNPSLPRPDNLDSIFPYFMGHHMPAFLRGLMLSAIIMASIDSPLSSLSTSFVTDLYRPLFHKEGTDAHYVRVSRIGIGVFAALLALIAYAFSFFQNILWLAFKIGGITFGSLLGVFLLGLLTQRRGNKGNVVAMIFMAVTNAVLLFLSENKLVPMAWSWLVIIGTAGTFAIGYVLGPRMDRPVATERLSDY